MRMILNKPNSLPLGELAPGARAEIVGFSHREGLQDFLLRLCEVGFIVGECVEVLQRAPFGGSPMSFRVKDATYALRKEDADLILVSPATP
jgi:Fe2+ transport system protein FeoA